MADQRFFKKSRNFSLREIIDKTGASVTSSKKLEDVIIKDVAPLCSAKSEHVSFLDNVKYKKDFKETKAGACFVSPAMSAFAPENTICLITPSPYKAYAMTAQLFYPQNDIENKIEQNATISDTAQIGENVYIGHNVVIGQNVEIGNGCYVGTNSVLFDGVQIGENCRIDGNVTISHAILGENIRIYPGVRIGQDGFGFAIDPNGHVKVPQLGRVIIEDHVEIGANTTIDRGAGPDTIIGQGTWIDNLVQIGHNVVIGKGCIIVSQVGISGSTKIDDYVAIGGQAGIAGHLNIGTGARIAAKSGIMADIPPASEYMGSPAFPKSQYLKQIATLSRLVKNKTKKT